MEWISVEERLPLPDDVVLCALPNKITFGSYTKHPDDLMGQNAYWDYPDVLETADSHAVTHWLPLPDPPKPVDKKDKALRAARNFINGPRDLNHWMPTLMDDTLAQIDAALELE